MFMFIQGLIQPCILIQNFQLILQSYSFEIQALRIEKFVLDGLNTTKLVRDIECVCS